MRTYFSLIATLAVLVTFAQNLEWAKSTGGWNHDVSFCVTVDTYGNVYNTGYFFDTVDFNPGTDTFFLNSNGNRDIYIQKLDASGNFVWARNMGGTISDEGFSIAVDASANVYVTGFFHDTVDFDPGPGVSNLISVGNSDVFILKLDSNGSLLWAKQIGGAEADEGISIALDHWGNVYVAGNFQLTVDFDPGPDTTSLTSLGNYDMFILKLNPNGDFLDAKQIAGTDNVMLKGLCIDDTGNLYATGDFYGTVDFDPNVGTISLSVSGSGTSPDIFVLKMDSAGNLSWVRSMGGTSYDNVLSIAIDRSGSVYTTGRFSSSVADFDPGVDTFNLTNVSSYDIFIQKLDVSGNFLWAKSMGGNSNYSYDQGSSIAVDINGNVYTAGKFQDTIDVDPGTEEFFLYSKGSYDIFIQKSDSNGNFLWGQSMGSNSSEEGRSIVVDESGNIYLAGEFYYSVDFAPGSDTFDLVSLGFGDIFVQKLDACELMTTSSVPSTCYGSLGICDASASVSVSNNPPFTFLWSDSLSQTTPIADDLCPGIYSVSVTNSFGCHDVDSVEVTDIIPDIILDLSFDSTICAGVCSGSATVSVSGTYPPYTYKWNDSLSQSTETASGLCSGTYVVTVTDTFGCISLTDSVEVLDRSPYINVDSITKKDVQCSVCDGSATVNISGTYPPFTYQWDDSAGQTDTIASGLCHGIYRVSISDTFGCVSVSDSIEIEPKAFPADSICLITVDSSSTRNMIVWEKPITQGIDSFRIYREVLGVYKHIGSVSYDSLSIYTDTSSNINPQITSYRYKLSVLDTCGLESLLSDYHETIHLQVSYGQTNNLSWDDYEGFPYSFYVVYRKSQGMSVFAPIYSLSASSNTWTDIAPPAGNNEYYVAVDKGGFCTPVFFRGTRGPIGVTISNIEVDAGAVTSIDENTYGVVSVYPNPFERSTRVCFNAEPLAQKQVTLYDLLGKQVRATQTVTGNTLIIERGSLTPGPYILELQIDGSLVRHKLVVK